MARRYHGTDPADVLRELIDLQGFSIRGLAKELAGPKASDNQWENQRRELTEWVKGRRRGGNDPLESLDHLAKALKVPVYLLRLLYRQADVNQQVRAELEQALALLPAAEEPLEDVP